MSASQETFFTRTQAAAHTPVEALQGVALEEAAAVAIGDVDAILNHRGMGAPEIGTIDPVVQSTLATLVHFDDRMDAAMRRAEHLGYPLPPAVIERHDAVVDVYLAQLVPTEQSALLVSAQQGEPTVTPADLGERQPYYHLLGEEARDIYDGVIATTLTSLVPEAASIISEELTAAGLSAVDSVPVIERLAARFALREVEGYERGKQAGIDFQDATQRQQWHDAMLQLSQQKSRGGVY